jgi:hypothetical protein
MLCLIKEESSIYLYRKNPVKAMPLFDERSVEVKAAVNFRQPFSFLFWKVHMLLSIFA